MSIIYFIALSGASRAVGYPTTANYGQKPKPTLKVAIKNRESKMRYKTIRPSINFRNHRITILTIGISMMTRLRWLVKNSIETKHRNCESGSCGDLCVILVFMRVTLLYGFLVFEIYCSRSNKYNNKNARSNYYKYGHNIADTTRKIACSRLIAN